MKDRYFTPHTREDGHRVWLESPQLPQPSDLKDINSALSMGALRVLDAHILTGPLGERNFPINPNGLMFLREDRYKLIEVRVKKDIERKIVVIKPGSKDWDYAQYSSLVFYYLNPGCRGCGHQENLHILSMRCLPAMGQIECPTGLKGREL